MTSLKLALTYVRECELVELPSETELKKIVPVSAIFEKRMEELWRDAVSGKPQRKMKNLLLIAILAAMMASVMSVQAIREPVVRFFMDIYENCTEIIFRSVETETVEENDFFIPSPPAGYVETSREELQTQVKAEYATQSGDYMRYTQYDLEGVSLSVDTEEADVMTDEIQGYSVFIYSKNEFNSVVWGDGRFGYKVNATCPMPELMNIVEQIIGQRN